MLGLNLADLLYVIGMIELLLFGVGVWWLRCHIISFFFLFFGRDRYSLHKCNDNNLKEM